MNRKALTLMTWIAVVILLVFGGATILIRKNQQESKRELEAYKFRLAKQRKEAETIVKTKKKPVRTPKEEVLIASYMENFPKMLAIKRESIGTQKKLNDAKVEIAWDDSINTPLIQSAEIKSNENRKSMEGFIVDLASYPVVIEAEEIKSMLEEWDQLTQQENKLLAQSRAIDIGRERAFTNKNIAELEAKIAVISEEKSELVSSPRPTASEATVAPDDPLKSLPATAVKTIHQQAALDWPGNQRMQQSQIKGQAEAWRKMENYATYKYDDTVPVKISKEIVADSRREWPMNYRMQVSHFEDQVTSYQILQEWQRSGAPGLKIMDTRTAIQSAQKEWPNSYRMQVYEVKKAVGVAR